jgi:hypothetical protein
MTTLRVMPPPGGATQTIEGRTYVGVSGTPLDVVDADAYVLAANGWTISAKQGVGTTAQRPANPQRGDEWIDTTVGAHIKFDGKVWRHSVTHATV